MNRSYLPTGRRAGQDYQFCTYQVQRLGLIRSLGDARRAYPGHIASNRDFRLAAGTGNGLGKLDVLKQMMPDVLLSSFLLSAFEYDGIRSEKARCAFGIPGRKGRMKTLDGRCNSTCVSADSLRPGALYDCGQEEQSTGSEPCDAGGLHGYSPDAKRLS